MSEKIGSKDILLVVSGVLIFFVAIAWNNVILGIFQAIFGAEVLNTLPFLIFYAVLITILIVMIIRFRRSFSGI